MKSIDVQYIELAQKIFQQGIKVTGRNGLVYTQLFGEDIMLDLREEFPVLSLRKMPLSNLYREFMWDICGKSDIESLGKARHFWEFLSIDGWLPGSYGASWRNWPVNVPTSKEDIALGSFRANPFDQLKWVYNELKENPLNRQLVVQTYNPAYEHNIAKCPPCHPSMVFSSDGHYLDLLVLGRSQDMATGLPLDVIRYSLLLEKMAMDCKLFARFLKVSIANVHIYETNEEKIKLIISREPRGGAHMAINRDKELWDLNPETDFIMSNYIPHSLVHMEVAK